MDRDGPKNHYLRIEVHQYNANPLSQPHDKFIPYFKSVFVFFLHCIDQASYIDMGDVSIRLYQDVGFNMIPLNLFLHPLSKGSSSAIGLKAPFLATWTLRPIDVQYEMA